METFKDNVIVEVPETEERSQGGILLPGTVKDGFTVCNVVAVGPGREDKNGNVKPLTVKVGDRVMVNAGTGVKLEKNMVLIREDDIFGIVTDE